MAFKIEDLMTKVIPGGTGIWACPDDTQRAPRPGPHPCPDDTRNSPCPDDTRKCPDDTQQTHPPTGPDGQPRRASGLDTGVALSLLQAQLRERLSEVAAGAGL
ncbi:MAG TPA: hypothetical protein VGH73_25190 [Thermoanaerobaculia bacterium]